jgi:two-component system sensor histidine kinase RegB
MQRPELGSAQPLNRKSVGNKKNMYLWSWITGPLKKYFLVPFPTTDDDRAKLQWITRLRWLMIFSLVSMTPIALFFGALDGLRLLTYLGVTLLLICFNILTQSGYFDRKTTVQSGLILFQLSIDLLALTGLLVSPANGLNSFYVLFYVNVSLGATLIEGKSGVLFLLFCHQALFLVQIFSGLSAVDSRAWQSFLAHHVVLAISWGVSRSLGQYVSLQKEKLHQVKLFAEKMDRLRALGAMSAGFSHEFASPLSTVKLRLNREIKANPQSENLQEMNFAVLECESVIRQMNQAQMDPRDFQFQVFNLNKATQNILSAWLIVNPKAKTSFVTKTHLDKVRLPVLNYSQALINLLDNALEANPQGMIFLEIDQVETKIIVTIENEGSKFSEDVLARFGEPFVTTKSTGTGLGLYSVQLFAQSAGGKAMISNSTRGARVALHFPPASVTQDLQL